MFADERPAEVLAVIGMIGLAIGVMLVGRATRGEPVDTPSIFRDHDLEPRYQVPEPDERVKVDD